MIAIRYAATRFGALLRILLMPRSCRRTRYISGPMWSATAIAFGVPVIFLLCGAMGRKLMRGTTWDRRDFYLGVELALATFSANLLFIIELLRAPATVGGRPQQAYTAPLFLALVFGIYIWLLTLHQDWEPKTDRPKGQLLRLVILSNAVGILLFASFVFMIKGVR